jgi:hypothetical protein
MNDIELINQFEMLTLPFEQWTHRAHVRVAYCYLSTRRFREAMECICSGIRAFNAANNVPKGPTSGYNETTTVAFIRLIFAVMQAYGKAMPTADSEAFYQMHPQLMHRHVLRFFYSPEQRLHPDAKRTFVPPDLTDLPHIATE